MKLAVRGASPGSPAACRLFAELVALGELARSAAQRAAGPRVDEVGLALAAKVVDVVSGQQRARSGARPADRRRAIESAKWIEIHADQEINLQSLAAQTGLSVYHYLRGLPR